MRTISYIIKEKMNTNPTPDEIPSVITLDVLADEVRQMRHLQKRYFATRNADILIKSKEAEARVDKMISKIFDTQMALF